MCVVQSLTFIKVETARKWLLPKEYGMHVSVLLTSCQNNVSLGTLPFILCCLRFVRRCSVSAKK